jgi:hypothetical protein
MIPIVTPAEMREVAAGQTRQHGFIVSDLFDGLSAITGHLLKATSNRDPPHAK